MFLGGRLCRWRHQNTDAWEDSLTFQEYKDSLYRNCENGYPSSLAWTVPEDAPDLLYYQVTLFSLNLILLTYNDSIFVNILLFIYYVGDVIQNVVY